MKPILFPSTATEFKTQGLGVLTDAISCTVTEERNGAFELTMQYPDTGVHFDEITDRCIIYAIPSPYRAPQPFRIYRITRPMNGVIMVYAQHITYDLSGVPLNPFTAINAPDALSKLSLNAAVNSPFVFWTDKSTSRLLLSRHRRRRARFLAAHPARSSTCTAVSTSGTALPSACTAIADTTTAS